MGTYILKRFAQLILVLFGVTFLTFIITSIAPSDPAEMLYISRGIVPSSELLETTREEMGLNDPLLIRYGKWLTNCIQGDFGISTKYGEPVSDQMLRKLPMTILLAAVSGIVMFAIALPLGVLCAVKKNKFTDYIIRFTSFIGLSIPNFWLALLLMLIFSVWLGWFSTISNNTFSGMILPVATLAIPLICRYIRQIRAAVLEELSKDYVLGARARGIKESRILFCHVLSNAMLPIITLMGLSVGHLLGGAAIVESIFSYRGIGDMVIEAIRVRDYPIIQAYVIWMAIIYVGVNLLVDISYMYLDPKMRLKRRGA